MTKPMTAKAQMIRDMADECTATEVWNDEDAMFVSDCLRAYADMLDQQAPDDLREAVRSILQEFGHAIHHASDRADDLDHHTNRILALIPGGKAKADGLEDPLNALWFAAWLEDPIQTSDFLFDWQHGDVSGWQQAYREAGE